jgi:predicted DNA-binding transcriptional regulator AlpA
MTAITNAYSSFNDLPLVLNAQQLAGVLNIARANAYKLLHREDFPTLHIGKRMLVFRDKLVKWMDGQECA